ncbi:Cupredoxin [Phascolomyces articulosus]|uniref:Cupredoxin n=1 Tax=Phascolomyces articulosus TaxID=60185 RepID=A0AAD5JW47_9FUNG|nr:Cupredoxin [Phascolomyces articulosus]
MEKEEDGAQFHHHEQQQDEPLLKHGRDANNNNDDSFVDDVFTSLSGQKEKRIELDWSITYTFANPDGKFERQVIGVNGHWPPPIVEAELEDTVTIHNGSSIPPGASRTYKYHMQQTGTYWIHSHVQAQYLDGLRTPLIIHDPDDPYQNKYDEEIIITLSDWYHDDSRSNAKWFLSKENLDESGIIGDRLNPKYYFEPGKTYRLRIINVSEFITYYFSIDGHEFDVIEVDGAYTEPYRTKNFYVTIAQRMSILVKARNTTDLNYLIHADMDPTQFDERPDSLQLNITTPIFYDSTHMSFAPSEDIGIKSKFDDFNLRSLADVKAVDTDTVFNITVEQQIVIDGLNRGMINRIPFINSLTPTLFTELTMGELANNSKVYGSQGNAYITKYLDMIELVVNNFDEDAHPFHMHGHKFQVVVRSTKERQWYDGVNKVGKWNLAKPVYRDTIRIQAYGFVVLRYRSDNPGAWLFHCHIDWHFYSGMGIVLIEAPAQAQERMSIDPLLAEQCRQQGKFASGNAAGKEGLDLSGAPHGIFLPDDKPLIPPEEDGDGNE